jgi:hypothetical protein
MRRFFSITTIVALMSSSVLPLLAASCPHVKHVMACHRTEVQTHHCHGAAAESEPASERQTNGSAFDGGQASNNCPMDCCAPGQRTSAIAVPVLSLLSPLAVTEQHLPVARVVFTATGFSSHTDRGPPTA